MPLGPAMLPSPCAAQRPVAGWASLRRSRAVRLGRPKAQTVWAWKQNGDASANGKGGESKGRNGKSPPPTGSPSPLPPYMLEAAAQQAQAARHEAQRRAAELQSQVLAGLLSPSG